MVENLTDALEITLIGMSLVFGAIVLLWLVMLGLMRVLSDPAETDSAKTRPDEVELRRRAAITAVAVALARAADQSQPHEFPLPPTAIVTPWQAVQRSRQLTQKGPRK
ncbi:MAG: OadG family protein [Anaerolineae bacterium]|nr:OadG family protein [Anaerolineae bacterium]